MPPSYTSHPPFFRTFTHTHPTPHTHSPQALGCDVAVHAAQLFRRKTQRTKDMLARAWSDRARREHSERDRLLHQQLRPSNALLQEAMKYLKEYRWVAWVCLEEVVVLVGVFFLLSYFVGAGGLTDFVPQRDILSPCPFSHLLTGSLTQSITHALTYLSTHLLIYSLT